ncbi:MAG: electron transfer flavoprotein subunit alpha/FixB family protein [Acidobacteriota bacterium]|nr:electron transfer flavoprotein subunit alpha/FixB family protein [Acidobacteriota bacterium]MDE3092809.1 electron transfer flavoprotein subunit alpha/FixB family protein [Acidobacteriota bacterium]MDE3145839.1 electron transfer flavoprotein subunit alpha/FixB family protein [Acidobacteriota bacterium]
MSVSNLWVLAEPARGDVTTTSKELISEARRLGATVTAITWGANDDVARVVGSYGASRLWDLGDLGAILPASVVANTVASLLEGETPDAVLIPASNDGRDIAGRLSARLDTPVLTNVTGLRDGATLESEHPIFGGTHTVLARLRDSAPGLFVVRAKSFSATPDGVDVALRESVTPVTSSRTATIRSSHVEERNGPALEDAKVVVSGGRGLGDASSYALVEELARLLDGAPGASRAIVDAGWVPYSHQVGQTGKTVKPDLYVACGISGATQHMVGMKGAANVIAINKDPDAPIFAISDFGVVGDVQRVLPALIELLKARA